MEFVVWSSELESDDSAYIRLQDGSVCRSESPFLSEFLMTDVV